MTKKFSLAFTLVEIIIIITILAVLTVGVLALINPVEQRAKGKDSGTYSLTNQILSAFDRYYLTRRALPYSEDITSTSLTLSPASSTISILTSQEELKASLLNSPSIQPILLTSYLDPVSYHLCFRPASKNFRENSQLCIYNSDGSKQDTPDPNSCYLCTASIPQQNRPVTALTPLAPTIVPTPADPCDQDPDFPHYPTTSMYLDDQFLEYGCDRFSVLDRSCLESTWSSLNTECDTYCQPGQRCLIKQYTSTTVNFIDFINCLTHSQDARQYYCTDEPYSNCINHPELSSDLDFDYGCSNPMRPYQWK